MAIIVKPSPGTDYSAPINILTYKWPDSKVFLLFYRRIERKKRGN
jgi:hypothetical protein